MVQRSVLGMKLECQAIIRNCDCELFTRDLHWSTDLKSYDANKARKGQTQKVEMGTK